LVPANQLWYYDTNVAIGITYTYNVSAINGIGEGPNSTDVSTTPVTFPSAPRNLLAIAGNGYINLYWDEPSDDGGSPITNYRIYRGESSGGESFLNEIPYNTYYIDSDVEYGVTYYYRISAINIAGVSALSEEVYAIVKTVPTEPTDLGAVSGDSHVNLTWNIPASDGASPITGYLVYRNNTSDGTIQIFDVGDVLSFNDLSATNGIIYEYRISAKNEMGEGSLSNEVLASPMGLAQAPENLMLQAGDRYVNLSWNPPISDGGSEITGYNIYRDNDTVIFSSVPASELRFYDTDVVNGITYVYYISTVNGVGEGPISNDVSATPMTVPSAPSNLHLTAGDGYVNLTWDPSDDDGGSTIQSYRIYRGLISGEGTILIEIGHLNFYNDTSVINNRTYYYAISARNSVGEGMISNEVNGNPKAPQVIETSDPPPTPDDDVPLWLWLIHAILVALIAILFIISIVKRRTKEEEQSEGIQQSNGDESIYQQSPEPPVFEEDLPPPPPT
jgi:fibronectin type 3 domain-containing protein